MSKRAALIALAMLAMGGSFAAVNAADAGAVPAPVAEVVPNDLPRFVPGEAPTADLAAAADTALALDEDGAAQELADLGSGVASYYGKRFAGRPTASGEAFDPQDFTAAHRTLPFGSKVRVTNPDNGRSVVVRINDRGPFSRDRMIDLSRAAAEQVGLVASGHGTVRLALISS
ncbi:RlpA-like protein precursor [Altererythrobacter sp. B11]|uniref:septal ring lytic transglycosylase RlpA family protein n=1 Tax=Altererythrobacter sp. B11 TaxID=2060312 RepID=UPI000DC6FE0F|nr:septal ring lytic transglycosylase RlpA family protein [Altererythrobacter sp. B11]BBC72553.1 RlpA-like protein precursor [Altererythrobacter sp. B11]